MPDPAQLYKQLCTAFDQRAWQQALHLATQLKALVPPHAGICYMAGIACMELQQMAPAFEYLRKAVTLEPRRADYVVQFAKVLMLGRKNRDAKVVADRALALKPDNPMALDTLGVVYSQLAAFESAAAVFRAAATMAPNHAPYQYNLATALVAAGELDAAEIALDRCLSLDPKYWRAHLTRSQLRRQTAASNHVTELNSLLQELDQDTAAGGEEDIPAQICLNMALAKECEDLADYPKAFGHLVRGKSAGGAHRDYSIERDEAMFEAIIDSFPGTREVEGYLTEEPIFIIGMPRTGTTLVERIISSHGEVQSAGELLNFAMSLKHMSGSQSPALTDSDTIIRARSCDWKKLGEMYLSSTRPTTGQKPRFIDKLPHNFLYAGFIANALPQAKIICLRRDPMDTCLSNFRQLFAPKSPYFDYSFDLLDTGRYYILFDRLMAHWRKVLPGRIYEVDYGTLVDSQEESSRQLLQFCDLPWDDTCLSFESNPSPVATASAVQVREPIYRSALKRWKKYEPQLEDLHRLLSRAGIRLDP